MRIILIMALAAAFFAPAASAQPAPSSIQALSTLYACSSVTDPTARLACYDDATSRLRQAETTGQVAVVDSQRAAELERESFGLQLPNLTRLLSGNRERVENIETTIVRVNNRANGYHTFELANGQVWSQIEPQNVRNVRAGDAVTIERAALGSFRLISPRGGAAHRVRREVN